MRRTLLSFLLLFTLAACSDPAAQQAAETQLLL